VTLNIRATADPNHLDLYEDTEKIGEITCEPPDEDDPTDTDPPYWKAEVWSAMGTGKTWYRNSEDADEIRRYAHELYEEFVAERRELNRGARGTAISTPMGGQARRRR
jgi:hypothetical protein